MLGSKRYGTSILNRQYHLYAMGSVLAITDGSGSVETSYVTDAWGNVIAGSALGNTFDYMVEIVSSQ